MNSTTTAIIGVILKMRRENGGISMGVIKVNTHRRTRTPTLTSVHFLLKKLKYKKVSNKVKMENYIIVKYGVLEPVIKNATKIIFFNVNSTGRSLKKIIFLHFVVLLITGWNTCSKNDLKYF